MFGMTPAEIDAEVEKAMADLDREEADQRRALSQSVLYLIRENERLARERDDWQSDAVRHHKTSTDRYEEIARLQARVAQIEARFTKHVDPDAAMLAATS